MKKILVALSISLFLLSCSDSDDAKKVSEKIVKININTNDTYFVSPIVGSAGRSGNVYDPTNQWAMYRQGETVEIIDKDGVARPLMMTSEDGNKYVVKAMQRDITLRKFTSRFFVAHGLPSHIETIHVSGSDGYSYDVQRYCESVLIDMKTGIMYETDPPLYFDAYVEIGESVYFNSGFTDYGTGVYTEYPAHFDRSNLSIKKLPSIITKSWAFSDNYFVGYVDYEWYSKGKGDLLAKFYNSEKHISINSLLLSKYPDALITGYKYEIQQNLLDGTVYLALKKDSYEYIYYKLVEKGESLEIEKLFETKYLPGIYVRQGEIYVFDNVAEKMNVVEFDNSEFKDEIAASSLNIVYYKTITNNVYKMIDLQSGAVETINMAFNNGDYTITNYSVTGQDITLSAKRLSDSKSVVILYDSATKSTKIMDDMGSTASNDVSYRLTRIN